MNHKHALVEKERGVRIAIPAQLPRHAPVVVAVALLYILLWSSSFIATKVVLRHSPPLTLLAARLLAAACIMAALARRRGVLARKNRWSFLYLVFVISIAASLLWFWLLACGEASVVSAYFFLTPIFGIGLAALLLGEPFGARDGLGLGAVAAGIFLISQSAAVPRQRAE